MKRKNKRNILIEDAANCGSGVSGCGDVVSSQPSALPGTTFGDDWSMYGGTIGSGDVYMPYYTGYHRTKLEKMPYKIKKTLKNKKNKQEKMSLKNKKMNKVMNYEEFIKNNMFNLVNIKKIDLI